eukprot:3776380-Rhodomonas_salina.1
MHPPRLPAPSSPASPPEHHTAALSALSLLPHPLPARACLRTDSPGSVCAEETMGGEAAAHVRLPA